MVVADEPHGPGLQGLRRPRDGARPARRRHVPCHRARHGPLRRRPRDPGRPRHARVGRRAVRRLLRRRALRGRRRDRPRPGLDRLLVLRLGPPRRARGHVHGLAQPGPLQRPQAVPVRGTPHRAATPAWATSRGRPRSCSTSRPGRPSGVTASSISCPSGPTTCCPSWTWPRCARSRWWPTPPTAWAGWSCRSSSTVCPSTWTSCSPSSTEASPTTRPTPFSPRTWWR